MNVLATFAGLTAQLEDRSVGSGRLAKSSGLTMLLELASQDKFSCLNCTVTLTSGCLVRIRFSVSKYLLKIEGFCISSCRLSVSR